MILISQASGDRLVHSHITRGQSYYHIGRSRDPIVSEKYVTDRGLCNQIAEASVRRILRGQDIELTIDDIFPESHHDEYLRGTERDLEITKSILDGDEEFNRLLSRYYRPGDLSMIVE